MFAFAGASTFPTIQADMKVRSKFNQSAVIAITSKTYICPSLKYLQMNSKTIRGPTCLSVYLRC